MIEITSKMSTIKIKSSAKNTTVTASVTVPVTVSSTETTNINDSPSKVDSPSSTKSNFSIPKNLFSGFTDVLRNEQLKLAQSVAKEFGISYEEIVSKCFPEMPHLELTAEPTKPKVKKAKKESIANYADAKSLDDLSCFKIGDLKSILGENDLPISGSKTTLMARVWGIRHPDEAPGEPKKKRGRPSKTQSPSTVDVSQENTDECELDAEKMADFYVGKDDSICETASDSTTTYKLLKNKYIFMEGVEEMEFKGHADNGTITWTEDIPDELLKMLGMED